MYIPKSINFIRLYALNVVRVVLCSIQAALTIINELHNDQKVGNHSLNIFISKISRPNNLVSGNLSAFKTRKWAYTAQFKTMKKNFFYLSCLEVGKAMNSGMSQPPDEGYLNMLLKSE